MKVSCINIELFRLLYDPLAWAEHRGPHWGSDPSTGTGGHRTGQGFFWPCLFYSVPLVALKAISPGSVGAKPPPSALAGDRTNLGKASKTQPFSFFT